jgi:hypothetical protein
MKKLLLIVCVVIGISRLYGDTPYDALNKVVTYARQLGCADVEIARNYSRLPLTGMTFDAYMPEADMAGNIEKLRTFFLRISPMAVIKPEAGVAILNFIDRCKRLIRDLPRGHMAAEDAEKIAHTVDAEKHALWLAAHVDLDHLKEVKVCKRMEIGAHEMRSEMAEERQEREMARQEEFARIIRDLKATGHSIIDKYFKNTDSFAGIEELRKELLGRLQARQRKLALAKHKLITKKDIEGIDVSRIVDDFAYLVTNGLPDAFIQEVLPRLLQERFEHMSNEALAAFDSDSGRASLTRMVASDLQDRWERFCQKTESNELIPVLLKEKMGKIEEEVGKKILRIKDILQRRAQLFNGLLDASIPQIVSFVSDKMLDDGTLASSEYERVLWPEVETFVLDLPGSEITKTELIKRLGTELPKMVANTAHEKKKIFIETLKKNLDKLKK